MSEPIVLGGRKLRTIQQPTLRHQLYMNRFTRELGLEALAMNDGETPETFALRFAEDIDDKGRLFHLLAMILIDADLADRDWRPEMVDGFVAFLGDLQEEQDLRLAHGLIASSLLPFLSAGIESWVRTRAAFERAMVDAGATTSSASPSSEAGPQRSTTWLAGIRAMWKRFRGGRSRRSSARTRNASASAPSASGNTIG